MKYRALGKTGVLVAPIGLGAMNFGGPTSADEAMDIIDVAIDAGVNLVDTANSYAEGRSEEIVGRALKRNGKRESIFLATKFVSSVGSGPNQSGSSRYHIFNAVTDSLRRLKTDHIDLYQAHQPDFTMPVEETLGALDDLVHQGKIRYIGCSNFPAWKLMESLACSDSRGYARYVATQSPYNLLDRRIENEMIPLCEAHGLGIIAWSPIGGGILAGRYPPESAIPDDSRAARRPVMAHRANEHARRIGVTVAGLAAEAGLTSAQLALLWVKDQPGITLPLTGPRTVEQLKEALAVIDMNCEESLRESMELLNPEGTAVSDFSNVGGWMKMRVG